VKSETGPTVLASTLSPAARGFADVSISGMLSRAFLSSFSGIIRGELSRDCGCVGCRERCWDAALPKRDVVTCGVVHSLVTLESVTFS